jgi:hypothetical protein
MAGNSKQEIDRTVEAITNAFEMKDLGEPRLLLGIQISRDRQAGTLTLSQENYINNILAKFGYTDLAPTKTPLDPNVTLLKRDNKSNPPNPTLMKEYQEKLGSLMYAALGTMPQLAFAVQTLSQFSSNPGPEHLTALKRVFRYLVHAKGAGLVYGGGQEWPTEIIGYSDSDWASNPNDRISISGYTFLLGGAAISWSSKKQQTLALSSTEGEYMAGCYAAKQAIWLQRLFQNIKVNIPSTATLWMDNQSAINLTDNVMFHQRTKHIDIQYHFLRNMNLNGTISTLYCPTEIMVADIMTKALPLPRFQALSEMLGVVPT